MTLQNITQHEGKKYLREIHSAMPAGQEPVIHIDVYSVLNAFNVTCPATAHAIKKLLCAGERGKGDRLADLMGVMAALNRAIDFEKREQPKQFEIFHWNVFLQGRIGVNLPNVGDIISHPIQPDTKCLVCEHLVNPRRIKVEILHQ